MYASSPSPFGAQEALQRPASRPGPTNLHRLSSGDLFRGQPLLQPYAPQGMQQPASTRHTAPFLSTFYRTVWSVRMYVSAAPLAARACARVPPSVLQGGQIRGPVSALWGDVSGRFGFPAGQIRIGSPMTAGLSCSGRPCRRVCVSTAPLCAPSSAAVCLLACTREHERV